MFAGKKLSDACKRIAEAFNSGYKREWLISLHGSVQFQLPDLSQILALKVL